MQGVLECTQGRGKLYSHVFIMLYASHQSLHVRFSMHASKVCMMSNTGICVGQPEFIGSCNIMPLTRLTDQHYKHYFGGGTTTGQLS